MSRIAPEHSRCGHYLETDKETGRTTTADVLCCVHCGYMWNYQPGSMKRRGFCMACNGFVCGHRACREKGCVHRHRLQEYLDKGIPWECIHEGMKPIAVAVPAGVPGR